MANEAIKAESQTESDEPRVHRPRSRPFRFNLIAGPDRLRIYLLTANAYQVVKFDDPDGAGEGTTQGVVAELRTHRIYSVARIFSTFWMLVACWLIGWIAAELRYVEIQYVAYGIGVLSTSTFGAVMVYDFLQTLRLPRVLVSVRSDGEIEFFDGEVSVRDYQSLAIRTRWAHGSGKVMGNSTCTLDLIVVDRGRENIYQLAATSGAELGPIARRLSSATGIELEG